MVSPKAGFSAALAAWIFLAASTLVAQQAGDPPAASQPTEAAPAAADSEGTPDLDRLIRQLDSNRFAERQNASQALAGLGAKAIPALGKAALGESREASTRSIDILRRHFREGTPEAKAAAEEALKRIAASDRAVASRAAKQALDPKPEDAPPAGAPPGIPVPGIAPARIQIRMRAVGGANGRRVQVQNVNGVKTVQVQEQDKKYKIVDDPNKGIQVEITEKKDGKDVTRKFSAKNAEELKKNHPEAHKIYQKYGQQQGGIQIQAIQLGGLPPRIAPANQVPARIEPRNQIADRLDKVGKQVEEARQRIKQLAEKNDRADGEALRKTLEQLEQAAQGLKEARQKLLPGAR